MSRRRVGQARPADPRPPWFADRVTQTELAERERAIVAEALRRQDDPRPLIIADRLQRWTSWLHAMRVPREFHEWAARMQAAYGLTVPVWNVPLPWLLALLVVRYGEAEYWWPAEFQPADIARALEWEAGVMPAAVRLKPGRLGRA